MPFRSLPGTQAPGIRAVAGGALVALAMLGVLVAPGEAEAALDRYVVATDDIAPGTPLVDAPVTTMAMHVPTLIADRAVVSLADLDDAASRGAIPRGSMLLDGDIVHSPAGNDDGPEVTVTIADDRALGGAIRVGDAVDLVATYGSGPEGFSRIATVGAVVIDIHTAESALGIDPSAVLTLRLARSDDVLPVVHAARADALSVVRSTLAVDADATFVPQRPTDPNRP